MRVLFVIDNLSTGGAQRQMVNLALGLTRNGHQVRVFCYAGGDMLAAPLREACIPIDWHLKQSRYSVDVIAALSSLIAAERVDLVLSFLSTPNFYSLTAGRLARGRSLPILVSERSCDLPGVGRVEQLVRQLYRLADHVVANSFHQKQHLGEKYPFLRGRLSTIYNGYDLEVFAPAATESINHPLKILCVGSISPYKNGMCMVEALHILQQKGQPVTVTWIGEQVLAGNRLTALREMESRIAKYDLCGSWKWLGQRTDIAEQLHLHDVLVHPSYVEGLPNVVCEALACGRPVIVSNTLDHPLLVQDGESGFLFEWRDPSDLAEKIGMFAALSHERRAELGRKARKFAEDNLSLERYVNEYEALFTRMMAGRGR